MVLITGGLSRTAALCCHRPKHTPASLQITVPGFALDLSFSLFLSLSILPLSSRSSRRLFGTFLSVLLFDMTFSDLLSGTRDFVMMLCYAEKTSFKDSAIVHSAHGTKFVETLLECKIPRFLPLVNNSLGFYKKRRSLFY